MCSSPVKSAIVLKVLFNQATELKETTSFAISCSLSQIHRKSLHMSEWMALSQISEILSETTGGSHLNEWTLCWPIRSQSYVETRCYCSLVLKTEVKDKTNSKY